MASSVEFISRASLDLGASPFTALVKVVLPEIMPGIFSGFLLAITLSLDDYIITVFTKADTFSTLSSLVYEKTKKVVPPAMRALTTLIFLLMLFVVMFINYRNKKLVGREKKH